MPNGTNTSDINMLCIRTAMYPAVFSLHINTESNHQGLEYYVGPNIRQRPPFPTLFQNTAHVHTRPVGKVFQTMNPRRSEPSSLKPFPS